MKIIVSRKNQNEANPIAALMEDIMYIGTICKQMSTITLGGVKHTREIPGYKTAYIVTCFPKGGLVENEALANSVANQLASNDVNIIDIEISRPTPAQLPIQLPAIKNIGGNEFYVNLHLAQKIAKDAAYRDMIKNHAIKEIQAEYQAKENGVYASTGKLIDDRNILKKPMDFKNIYNVFAFALSISEEIRKGVIENSSKITVEFIANESLIINLLGSEFYKAYNVDLMVDSKATINNENNLSKLVELLPVLKNDSPEFELFEAVGSGNNEKIREILKNVNVNVLSKVKLSLLMVAIRNNKIDTAELLIKAGVNIDARDIDGRTALINAVELRNLAAIWFLIKNKADLNIKTKKGASALSIASEHGFTEVVKLLLEHNVEVDSLNRQEFTPLLLAAARGQVDVVKILLAGGASRATAEGVNSSVLNLSIVNGQDKVVECLVNQGWSVNEVDDSGYTPLMHAAKRGRSNIASILLKENANPNYKKAGGISALSIAVENEHDDICEKILMSPLFSSDDITLNSNVLLMGYKKNNQNLVSLSRMLKINIERVTEINQASLLYAASNGNFSVASMLIDAKVNINALDDNGYTPLMVACEQGHLKVVVLLLQHDAKSECKTKNGELTALMLAVINGHVEIVRVLLKSKVNLNALSINGYSALIWAASKNRHAIITILLEAGANLNIRAKDGDTAYMIALHNHFADSKKAILEMMKKDKIADKNEKLTQENSGTVYFNSLEFTLIDLKQYENSLAKNSDVFEDVAPAIGQAVCQNIAVYAKSINIEFFINASMRKFGAKFIIEFSSDIDLTALPDDEILQVIKNAIAYIDSGKTFNFDITHSISNKKIVGVEKSEVYKWKIQDRVFKYNQLDIVTHAQVNFINENVLKCTTRNGKIDYKYSAFNNPVKIEYGYHAAIAVPEEHCRALEIEANYLFERKEASSSLVNSIMRRDFGLAFRIACSLSDDDCAFVILVFNSNNELNLDYNQTSPDGKTALDYANEAQLHNVIQFLLKNNAKTKSQLRFSLVDGDRRAVIALNNSNKRVGQSTMGQFFNSTSSQNPSAFFSSFESINEINRQNQNRGRASRMSGGSLFDMDDNNNNNNNYNSDFGFK